VISGVLQEWSIEMGDGEQARRFSSILPALENSIPPFIGSVQPFINFSIPGEGDALSAISPAHITDADKK
jgi:hypothetical protein